MTRNKEWLLLFARGDISAKQSYYVLYHVSPDGDVVIHSCERIPGSENMLIRFCRFNGTEREMNKKSVSEKEMEKAIKKYSNEKNRTISSLPV